MEGVALLLEVEQGVFGLTIMLVKILAFITNWLTRLGVRKLAFWISKRLYNSINIDKIYGEVYEDCHDVMKETMADIDQKWKWMQKEHILFLFGELTLSEVRPETAQLVRTFEELLPKKHPVAMATMEAFKADYRDDQVKKMLSEILRRLQIPSADAMVLFDNDKQSIVIQPKFKEVYFSKMDEGPEDKKTEKDELARLAVAGNAMDFVTKMMEQRANMVQATDIKPITGHRYDSFSPVKVGVWNSGDSPIESCTVFFNFPENVQLRRNNVKRTVFPELIDPKSPIWVDEKEHQVRFDVGDITLGLGRKTPAFYVRIPHDVKVVEVEWFLSSKTLKKYGKLTIINEPEIIPERKEVKNVPEVNPQIEDCVVTMTD